MTTPVKDANRLHELDALRFLAAASVVVYHMTYTNSARVTYPEVDAVTRFGYIGVNLFFIISGFVILWSAQGRTPVAFAISRFSRLYPIFWVSILATSAVIWHAYGITIRQVLLNATMFSGYLGTSYIDVVYWTLQIELKFYLLVFILLAVGKIGRAEACAFGWIALTALATAVPRIPGTGLILFPYGSYFAAGMILFQVWTKGLTWLRGAALAVSLLLSMHQATVQMDDFVYHATAGRWVPAAVIACVYILLLGVATHRVTLRWPAACTALGASTYPLYLLHNRIGHAILGALPLTRWPALAITLAAIVLIAAVATALDRRLHRFTRRTLTGWSVRAGLQRPREAQAPHRAAHLPA